MWVRVKKAIGIRCTCSNTRRRRSRIRPSPRRDDCQPLEQADAGVDDGDDGDEQRQPDRPCDAPSPSTMASTARPASTGASDAEHRPTPWRSTRKATIVRRCGRANSPTRRHVRRWTTCPRRVVLGIALCSADHELKSVMDPEAKSSSSLEDNLFVAACSAVCCGGGQRCLPTLDPWTPQSWRRCVRARSSIGRGWRPTSTSSWASSSHPASTSTCCSSPTASANLTYLLRFGATELVLRRPPFGAIAPGAHDMRREHRVLVPAVGALRPGAAGVSSSATTTTSIGADFFVMERRTGEVVRDGDAGVDGRPHRRRPPARAGARRRHGRAAPRSTRRRAELGDLGRPDGFVAPPGRRLEHRWALVRPDDGPPEHGRPPRAPGGHDAGADAAVVDRPQRPQAGQLPVRPGEPRSRDVHLRLGHDDARRPARRPRHAAQLLARSGRPSPAQRGSATRGSATIGLPTRAEVVARYAERTGIDVSPAGWYEAFAQWKTGVVVQQLHRRWERGESTDPRMAVVADRLPLLAATASALLDRL